MKKLHLLKAVLVFMVVFYTSCSSEDSDDNGSDISVVDDSNSSGGDISGEVEMPSDNNSVNDVVDFVESAEMTYNGIEYTMESSNSAVRSGDQFSAVLLFNDNIRFQIKFNKYGEFGHVDVFSANDFEFEESSSLYYYASYSFDFELTDIDEVNKTITATFSGELFEDNFDINSTQYDVKGGFSIPYRIQESDFEGIVTEAVIDGDSWHSINSEQGGFVGTNITLASFNNDEYYIGIVVNDEGTAEATYIFDEDSTVNTIVFSVFDKDSGRLIDYETKGGLTITEKDRNGSLRLIQGIFSFTATNPEDNSTITVTEGRFFEIY